MQFLVKISDIIEEDTTQMIPEFSDISDYNELFTKVRALFPDQENSNMLLYLPRIGMDEETGEELADIEIQETEDQGEKFLFEDGHPETEVKGEMVKLLNIKYFFRKKYKLCVYFFAGNSPENKIYFKKIETFANRFLADHKNYYLNEPRLEFRDVVGTIEKEEQDLIIVITAGRTVSDVMAQESNLHSILIYTSNANLDSLKETYKDHEKVKKIHVSLDFLLKTEYFFEELQ